jgi:hypothetical protein
MKDGYLYCSLNHEPGHFHDRRFQQAAILFSDAICDASLLAIEIKTRVARRNRRQDY